MSVLYLDICTDFFVFHSTSWMDLVSSFFSVLANALNGKGCNTLLLLPLLRLEAKSIRHDARLLSSSSVLSVLSRAAGAHLAEPVVAQSASLSSSISTAE